MKTITAEELKKKIDSDKNFKLVNVLSKESFDVRHIPKSISIPDDEIEEKISKEFPDKSNEIIIHCASTTCQASTRAAKKLKEMGYTNVIDFESGLAGWEEAGYDFDKNSS